ncbi:EpsG family protein [Myroides sp. LJL115]
MYIKEKSKKPFDIFSLFVFLVAPFLAVPSILIGIYNHKRGSKFIFSMFMGILSFLLLPQLSLDISRYYEHYEEISLMRFRDFLDFLSISSDYIFYSIFYVCAFFGLKFQWVLFLLTTLNFYVIFSVFDTFLDKNHISLPKLNYFYCFIFVFLSLGLLSYLSATRFTLATSFFILFVDYFYYLDKKKKGLFFLVLSILTHIGMIIFVPIIFVLFFFRNISKKSIIKFVTVFVIALLVIPISVLLLPLKPVVPGLVDKIIAYVEFEGKDGNWVSVISHMLTIGISLIVLVRYSKFLSKGIFNSLVIAIIAVSITLPFGHVVYDRYMLVLKPVLCLVFIYLYNVRFKFNKRDKINFNILIRCCIVAFILYTVFSLYFYRENIKPYYNTLNWFMITIVDTTYTYLDFLRG